MRRFRGKKFIPLFLIGTIAFMIVGIWLTWTVGKALGPMMRERRQAQIRKEQAERDRLRAAEEAAAKKSSRR